MPAAAGIPPASPQYNRTLFVNREDEIDLVKNKAQPLSLGQPIRERTIVFWGYKGTGRTWLLNRLAEVIPDWAGCQALYLDLDRWTHHQSNPGVKPNQAVREILGRLARQTNKWLGRPVSQSGQRQRSVDDRSQEFLAGVQDLLASHVLVLLLDHVYEADWELLERLEEHCLALLAVQPRVLLIMAGRGQAYPWKTPELRLYVKDHHLAPFDKDRTEEQLEKQQPAAVPRTPQIHEMSQGYPLGNYLLAARLTVQAAMQETVDGLLEEVSSEERSWLEAVCVLRTFDEERLPALLAAYFGDPDILNWPYKQVRQTRDGLLQTRMVRWMEEAGGWEVDKAIRPLLEKYLQETKPPVWQRLHCAAYQLYDEWQQAYADEKQRWQDETRHHAECLNNAGYDLDQCL